MQDFIDLYKNGYVPESATNDGFNETVANFKSGKTAMFIHHIGSSKGMVEELGDDVDAFIIPKGKGQVDIHGRYRDCNVRFLREQSSSI